MITAAGVWVAISVAFCVFWAFVHRDIKADPFGDYDDF